jgi:hypothetical protein
VEISDMQKFLLIAVVAAAIVLSSGCHSKPLKIKQVVGQDYDVLGEGKGSATGIMLFNIIPIGQNARFVRAHQRAIDSLGGDAIIEPEISERWFWAYILNGYTTTVKGKVVKLRK